MSGLGEAGASIAVYGLVEKILKKAVAAKRLKSKCRALAEDCQRMRTVLDSNSAALQASATENDLRACLNEVLVFVEQCTRKWSYLHNGWEVVWEKRFPHLQSNLSELAKNLMLESILANRTDIRASTEQIEQLQTSIAELTTSSAAAHDDDVRERETDRRHRREITDALISELKVSKSGPKFKIAFRYPNTSSNEASGIYNVAPAPVAPPLQSVGDLLGSLHDGRRVICTVLQQSRPDLEQWIPKPAKIYSLLAAETQVQGYFGILEQKGRYYNVWEDLSDLPNLYQWLKVDGIPNRLTALRVAYEISSTIAYFHSVQVLLKALNDETIKIRKKEGAAVPVLTGVERARMLVEPSQRTSYDLRYEAPEYRTQQHHTKFTDIWSLGIIIWQIFSARIPYGMSSEQSLTQKNTMWRKLEAGQLIWVEEDSISQLPAEIVTIIHACCSRAPLSRPTGSEVASQLLDLLTVEAAKFAADGGIADRIRWDAERGSRISDTVAAQKSIDVADFLFLTKNADRHASAAYLVGAAIWKELVQVDTIAQYSDEFSQATYMTPEEKRARRALLYFQDAANAGFDDSFREISEAFQLLGDIYQGRHKYTKSLSR